MTKIYSRWRFKIPKIKKVSKFRLVVFLLICFFIIGIVLTIYAMYPIFIISCKNSATSTGIEVINNEINKIINEYTYKNLIKEEKDSNGNILLISANIVPINQIISKVNKNIQYEINNERKSQIVINIGTITGISFLNKFSPRLDIEFETVGNVNTSVESKFESVGINQTLHRIYLHTKVEIIVLTPFSTIRRNY